jgi:hypothetical protein
MPVQDTSLIKEKIISVLKRNGPSLPVHIAREIDSSILFTSAFLSELVSEKKIKISNLKVGNSPLYLIEGQEHMIEKYSPYLKSKEKEAFHLLKEKKFLKDSEQYPAIRVALREIKDFALPFQKPETKELYWKFFTIPDSEFLEKIKRKQQTQEKPKEKELDIFDPETEKRGGKAKKKIKKKPVKGKSPKENRLLNKVKEFLSERAIEIIEIISFDKNEIILKIRGKDGETEKIFIAYNKKKVNEADIVKAGKKAAEFRLPYVIASPGEPLKKVKNLIDATKNLYSFEKL